jgi:hypothetical protein
MSRLRWLLPLLLSSGFFSARAQIPVEVFGGNRKATLDAMFFRYVKNAEGENSRFLFFNRNRASFDYRQTTMAYLPQFAFTEAFSYNHPKWKGVAPVVVVQANNQGVYPKAGVQYARIKPQLLLFSWVVMETLESPRADFFLLFRCTPALTPTTKLFTQIESFNSFPTASDENFTFVQRLRLGLKLNFFQFGLGADFSESGREQLDFTSNAGAFVRYEF